MKIKDRKAFNYAKDSAEIHNHYLEMLKDITI